MGYSSGDFSKPGTTPSVKPPSAADNYRAKQKAYVEAVNTARSNAEYNRARQQEIRTEYNAEPRGTIPERFNPTTPSENIVSQNKAVLQSRGGRRRR